MEEKFILSVSPHLKTKEDVPRVMLDVIIALIPASLAAVYFFRWYALRTILVCLIFAPLAEWVSEKIMKRKNTIDDLSAVVTGLLLALTLPPTLPPWIAAIGVIVAIVLGKAFFGGLGWNPFNPALVGRAVLVACWPVEMTTWIKPVTSRVLQAVTTATPLNIVKEKLVEEILPTHLELFLGNRAGSLGETSVLALLIGGIYLLYRRQITWHIPLSYLGVVALSSFLLKIDVLFQLFTGGLILGAFFMATDYVTSPLTRKGQIIFGLLCGLMTMLIRLKGGFPEGVCYSILIVNMLTPTIDKLTVPKKFGARSRMFTNK
ncbi:MAG TPA: hypothetical protein DHV62_01975 [Elusimicrobia bacterium]|jgi:electron transport complex protein RnfD|nr:hypothetical protein [Elusimicrobiota bacterium]